MTFREYVETLYRTGLFGKNKISFASELFCEAVTVPSSDPSMETIKSWIYKEKQSGSQRYFQNGLMDELHFIDYFTKRTKDADSWKKIQNAFNQVKIDESFRIDLKTDDQDVFFWSLLNQFQRIFQLPESEREEKEPVSPATVTPQELSPAQIRNVFLEAVHYYNIMGIINRKPPFLNHQDSTTLFIFVEQMKKLNLDYASRSSLLCIAIKTFLDALYIEAITVEANLNITFGCDNETASFNMEGDERFPMDKARSLGVKTLPEILSDLFIVEDDEDDEDDDTDGDEYEDGEDCDDPMWLVNLARDRDWKTFRREMNLTFEKIVSWKDEI